MNAFNDKIDGHLGYCITEQFDLGSKTIVFRGIREKDQKPVVIKIMRHEYPTLSDITWFYNQYTIPKNLYIPGIVKPYIATLNDL